MKKILYTTLFSFLILGLTVVNAQTKTATPTSDASLKAAKTGKINKAMSPKKMERTNLNTTESRRTTITSPAHKKEKAGKLNTSAPKVVKQNAVLRKEN